MSEFEEFARSQGFGGDFQRGCNGQYKSDLLHFMEKAFMHQQTEIYRLNNVLAERTKEWLEAIECGTYFENVAKPLKAENDSLKTQLNNMEACYIEKKKQVEAVSQVLCELKESLKDFQEMDLYDKGYRVAVEYVIADLEKALRGTND